TWLRKKTSGCIALRPRADRPRGRTLFEVAHAATPGGFDFDPGRGMEGTATTCLCCQSSVPARYIRAFGESPGYGRQLMCMIAVNPFGSGKLYLTADSSVDDEVEREGAAEDRARKLEIELGVTPLDAVIPPTGNAGLATGKSYLYGIRTFREAYTPRQ